MQNTQSLIQKAVCHYGCKKFDEIVAWYMLHGFVYIGQDAVILAQTTNKESLFSKKNALDKKDCWYVQYAAGNLNRFFEVCPFELEWAVFERFGREKRRAYKFSRIKEIIHGSTRYSKSKSTSAFDKRG